MTEWIDANEEYPPQGTMVLCCDMTATEARHWAFVGWNVPRSTKPFSVRMPNGDGRRATHWQHLPEPPWSDR